MEAGKCSLNNFPTKLWQLVNDGKVCAVIWNSRGNGIIVRQDLVESQVLSLDSFRATSFMSFVRQLHYYGFRKFKRWSKGNPNIHHYTHPDFIRSHPERLSLVQRVPRRQWCKAQAAVRTTAQPSVSQSYGPVGPCFYCNMPRMPAQVHYVVPNPGPMRYPLPANPNMFYLNHSFVSGFWDSQSNPVAPYYFNPCGLYQMAYTRSTNQVPAPVPQAPVSLLRRNMASSSTSISQQGIVNKKILPSPNSSKNSTATKQPCNNAQSSPPPQAGTEANEPT